MNHKIHSLSPHTKSYAHKDPQTGLHRIDFFLAYLEQEMHRLKRYGTPFSMAMLKLRPCPGPQACPSPAGDAEWKRRAVQILQRNIRQCDLACRIEGDHFAVMLVGVGLDYAMAAARRLKSALDQSSEGPIKTCIGLSSFASGLNQSVEKAIAQTQAALQQAEAAGQGSIFQPPLGGQIDFLQPHCSILIVDDEPLNLKYLLGLLKPLGHTVLIAHNGREALEKIEETEIDLVLLDIMMPQMDGFEVCRLLKSNDDTRMIPVVLLTALDDTASRIRGIEAGADDFVTKPPNRRELLARVEALLQVKRMNGKLTSIENVLISMAKTVEAKDSYTQGHIDRVSALGLAIGRSMGLDHTGLEALRFGGALHDIGKMGIPEEILNKPGPLDEREWGVMKTHPEIGYEICYPLKKNLGQALDIVRHHHEKLDGSGYPDGLRGTEISLVARIMAAADIYDALTTDRPYRKALTKADALSIMIRETSAGKIDPQVTHCLTELARQLQAPETIVESSVNIATG
jgi:putative two-component system response regulator